MLVSCLLSKHGIAALIWPDYTTFGNMSTPPSIQIAEILGGPWLKWTTIFATVVAWGIADALVAQAAISRIIYSMARDRKLPHVLSKIHHKFKTPYIATYVVAAISFIVTMFFSAQIGQLVSIINFGALSAFLILHISVINYYIRKQKSTNYFGHLVLPAIGFLVIAFVWFNLDPMAKKLGFIWLGIGVLYFIYLKYIRKDVNINNEL